MKAKNVFWFLCLSILCLSCSKYFFDNNKKLSKGEAHELINQWLFTVNNPKMNPAFIFSIEEATTTEIWRKMEAQLFYVPELENLTIYIKDSKIFNLSKHIGAGGSKLENLVVSDLNNDKIKEICYTVEFGSGIRYTSVACFIEQMDTVLFAEHFQFQTGFSLFPENNNRLALKQKKEGKDSRIGYLLLGKKEGVLSFKLEKETN